MHKKLLLLTVVFTIVTSKVEEMTRENMPGAKYYDGKKFVFPISDETMEEILDRWMQQAMSGLLSGVSIKKFHF